MFVVRSRVALLSSQPTRCPLLQPTRSRGADRGLASPLQYRPSAQLPRLSSASARGGPAPRRKGCAVAGRTSYGERAPGQLRRGAKAHASLTFQPDHPMGAASGEGGQGQELGAFRAQSAGRDAAYPQSEVEHQGYVERYMKEVGTDLDRQDRSHLALSDRPSGQGRIEQPGEPASVAYLGVAPGLVRRLAGRACWRAPQKRVCAAYTPACAPARTLPARHVGQLASPRRWHR